MNKKIFFLVLLQICLFATQSFAQTCFNKNITCLDSAEQQVNLTGASWWASHGDPATIISSNNAPISTVGTGSLSLWSFGFLNMGSGAFTCFKFQQGHTYRVCFWVRNTSGMFGEPANPWGRLKVYAAYGMYANYNPGMLALPTPSKQLIDQSYYGPGQDEADANGVFEWEFVNATFTADHDYTNLWFYPDNPMGFPAPGSLFWHLNYTVEVDDIRVMELPTPFPNITVTPVRDTIVACNDQTVLTVNAMPSNYLATWTPAATLTQLTSNWSQVIASPCGFTIYKIVITDPSSSCPNCIKEIKYDTIDVIPVSDPANVIINPVSPVPCGSTFSLDYNNTSSCTPMHYVWVDPTGKPYPGFPANNPLKNFTADAKLTGEWTLKILYMGKACYEEIKFDVVVGSCCISSPSFNFSGSNPISFHNTSSGTINPVASLWNFGDGTMSDATNPVHSYNNTQQQVYYVCLTALYTDEQGESCCNQVCDFVDVYPNTNACAVSADFDYAAVIGWGDMFDFTDASSGSGTLCDYEWDFGDGQILMTTTPTIRHQYVAGGPPGPWTVCLTVTNCVYDANGTLVATCKNKKCIVVDPVVSPVPGLRTQPRVTDPQSATNSISEPSSEKVLTVYPNPNQGSFILSLRKHTGNYKVVLRDKQGREVYSHEHEFGNGSAHIILGDISNGTYTVEVVNDNDKFVQQIVIAK